MWLGASTARSPLSGRGKPSRNTDGTRARPRPEWIVELGIGTGRPPVAVHTGDCYAAGKRRRAVDRNEVHPLPPPPPPKPHPH
ncbi:DUF6233 domain-containing protein, partial [Streptomyces sp. JV178]|uniref:DUF6233 domain-containing protein n=1 Tax=Streptomyces sp. JV178 TaxID=858632 RepID=UPI00211E0B93